MLPENVRHVFLDQRARVQVLYHNGFHIKKAVCVLVRHPRRLQGRKSLAFVIFSCTEVHLIEQSLHERGVR